MSSPLAEAMRRLTTPVTYTDEEVDQRRAALGTAVKSLFYNPEAYSGVKIPPSVPPEQALSYLSDQARSGNFQAPPIITAQAAYHGTPHVWEGPGAPLEAAKGKTFDLSKIGTGEGAQAYGWGAYATKEPKVAESYRRALAEDADYGRVTYQGRKLKMAASDNADPVVSAEDHLAMLLSDRTPGNNVLTPAEAIATTRRFFGGWQKTMREVGTPEQQGWYDAAVAHLDSLDPQHLKYEHSTGRLYKLDAPEDAEMLHWDKPIAEQSLEVKKRIAPFVREIYGEPFTVPIGRNQHSGDTLVDLRLDGGGSLGAFPAETADRLIASGEWVNHVPLRGEDLYRRLNDSVRAEPPDRLAQKGAAVAERLRSAGIPGHLYRGDTSGVENMVIYDPSRAPVTDAYTSLADMQARADAMRKAKP